MSGVILEHLDAFAAMLRDCHWFRRALSEVSPFTEAEAAARIHFDALPVPKVDAEHHSREELDELRPFALYWTADGGLSVSSDGVFDYAPTLHKGTITVRLEATVPKAYRDDLSGAARWFAEWIGRIISTGNPDEPGLFELSGQAGYLPIRNVTLAYGPARTDKKRIHEDGDAIACEIDVAWGNT